MSIFSAESQDRKTVIRFSSYEEWKEKLSQHPECIFYIALIEPNNDEDHYLFDSVALHTNKDSEVFSDWYGGIESMSRLDKAKLFYLIDRVEVSIKKAISLISKVNMIEYDKNTLTDFNITCTPLKLASLNMFRFGTHMYRCTNYTDFE